MDDAQKRSEADTAKVQSWLVSEKLFVHLDNQERALLTKTEFDWLMEKNGIALKKKALPLSTPSSWLSMIEEALAI